MKKIIRRALGLLVCLALLGAACIFGAQAAGAKTCTCGEIPRVYAPGIGDSPLYMNYGTPEQTRVDVVDTEGLKTQILPIVKSVVSAVAGRSWERAGSALAALVNGLLGHLRVDEHGNSVLPISSHAVFDKEQDHRQRHDYRFDYDWRLDPMQNAVELNKFIREVLAGTGHKKVILRADSEGTLVAMAYFAQFGAGDIEHYISNVGAFNGLTLMGELFTGNIEISYRQTMEYLRQFGHYYAPEEGFMALFTPLADLLDSTGMAVPLIFALRQLLVKPQDTLYAEALIPLTGQWPALWGFVPDAYYEDAKAFMFGGDPKYKDFIKLIDNFHYKAGPGMADKIIAGINKKIKVSIIASYGNAPMPFTPRGGYDTDGLIDTARESCGATTAGVGRTFPEGYRQRINDGHNHVSPDLHIDASTCLLPDQTWFYKNTVHFFGGHGTLIDFLANSEKQPTVFDDPEFPQFMTRLPGGTAIATVPEEPAAPVTIGSSIWNFLGASGRAIINGVAQP